MSIIQQLAMKTKKESDNNYKSKEITYALSKQVPNMKTGLTIKTNYGNIQIDDADEASEIATVVESILERRLAKLEPNK